MATAKVNGVRLFYELNGTGEVPLLLVHGSWDSHHDWDLVVPRLADSFRVLTYDRRGHSKSERPAGPGSVREDVADLAALIEHLELEPDISHMLQTRTRMSKRSSLSRASTALIMQEAKHNSRDNFTAMMASKGHPELAPV